VMYKNLCPSTVLGERPKISKLQTMINQGIRMV
jgi:hypothetical protein